MTEDIGHEGRWKAIIRVVSQSALAVLIVAHIVEELLFRVRRLRRSTTRWLDRVEHRERVELFRSEVGLLANLGRRAG